MNNNANKPTSLSITFDNKKLLQSAKEAEKIATKAAQNIAKSVNKELSKIKFDKISGIDKLSKQFDTKLNPAIKNLNSTIKSLYKSLSQIEKTLSNIKINSNINIKGNAMGNGAFASSAGGGGRRGNNTNNSWNFYQDPRRNQFTPLWEWMWNQVKMRNAAIPKIEDQRLRKFDSWEDLHSEKLKQQAEDKQKMKDEAIPVGAVDENAFRPNYKVNSVKSKFGQYWDKAKEWTSEFFNKENTQQKKRKKSEDSFIWNMTRLGMAFAGLTSLSKITKQFSDVIREGGQLNLLSQFTKEDPSRLFAMNEAIKRTTHRNSYEEFEGIRQRIIDMSLGADPVMASILGYYQVNADKNTQPTELLQDIINSERFKSGSQGSNIALLNKMGIASDTAMALTSNHFNDDYKHVSSIGTLTKQDVDNAKEILNTMEDLNQQSKIFLADFIQPVNNALKSVVYILQAHNDSKHKTGAYSPEVTNAYNDYIDGLSFKDKYMNPEKSISQTEFYNKYYKNNKNPSNFANLVLGNKQSDFINQNQSDIEQQGKWEDDIESGGKNIISKDGGAYGPGQLRWTTANDFMPGVTPGDLMNPDINKKIQLQKIQRDMKEIQKEMGDNLTPYETLFYSRLKYHYGTVHPDLLKYPNAYQEAREYATKHVYEFHHTGLEDVSPHIDTAAIIKSHMDAIKQQHANALYSAVTGGVTG